MKLDVAGWRGVCSWPVVKGRILAIRTRIFRQTGFYLGVPYALSKSRRNVSRLEKFIDRPEDLVMMGNYELDGSFLPKRPIVVSAGVGKNVKFEESLIKDNPETVLVLVDPTPVSCRYLESHPINEKVRFFPVALSDKDGELELFSDSKTKTTFDNSYSLSIYPRGVDKKKVLKVKTWRLKTLMKEADIERVDVLKMDIEGSAPSVLSDMLNSSIFPNQIACEIEVPPASEISITDFVEEIQNLLIRLESNGYRVYNIRREPHKRGRSLEILAIQTARQSREARGEIK
jgi:FkbM family methyltransferase